MAERKLRLRLGLFVAAALAVLFILVVLFGGTPSIFSNNVRYVVLFPEAPGVGPGTPVRKSGVRIGQVTRLDLDEQTGEVRVNIEVNRKHLPRQGEDANIARGLLSGDTSLDFLPKAAVDGTPEPRGEPYPPGSEIAGVPPVNARVLLSQASGAIPTAQESLTRITQAVPKIERTADEFTALAKAAREFIPELRRTNAQVQELLGTADPVLPRDRQVALAPGAPPPAVEPERITLRDVLVEIRNLLRSIRPTADDIRAQLKQNGPDLTKTLQALQRVADNTNELVSPETRKLVASLIGSLATASDDLTKTIRLAALLINEAEKTVKELNARVTQSERVFANLDKITTPAAANAEQIVRGISETVRNVNSASEQLNKTLCEVQLTIKALNNQGGTVQKLLTDPSLYNNLNLSVVGVARIMARVEKIARDLEVFADKIARKPETIGIGGALHPSTGLKESPNAPLPITPPLPLPPASQTQPPIEPIAPVPLTVPAYKPTTTPGADRPPLPSGRSN
jgi:phospholipid/cholesterol/gamma-HCH transport system substrate-binding protein